MTEQEQGQPDRILWGVAVAALLLAALAALFGFLAWSDTGGDVDATTLNGQSASDLAGNDGDTGPEGPVGPQGEAGAVGPAGPDGPQGVKGDRGQGIEFHSAVNTEADLPTDASPGDTHLVVSSGSLFVWEDTGDGQGATWHDIGHVQGPEGPAGPQGTQGVVGADGPEGPQGAQGVRGDTGSISFYQENVTLDNLGTDRYHGQRVLCKSGDIAVGGGYNADSDGHARTSAPSGPDGWDVAWIPETDGARLVIFVVCAAR